MIVRGWFHSHNFSHQKASMVYESLRKKHLFEEENRPSFMRITEKSIGLKLCSMHVPNSGLHSRTHSLMTLKVRVMYSKQ